MTPSHSTEVLRLRDGQAQTIEGTVEVVYADDWDDLCDVANHLASALRPFAGADCNCYGETSCQWCCAAQALKNFEDGDR